MRKLLLCIPLILSIACGGLRHGLVVTSATSHSVLNTVQATVNLTTCEAAPSLPKCITVEQRKSIADKFVKGYQLDKDIVTAIRNWDGTTPQPSQIGVLMAELTTIVNDIINLIPTSSSKTVMNTKLGAK